jgi:hypothetical protein
MLHAVQISVSLHQRQYRTRQWVYPRRVYTDCQVAFLRGNMLYLLRLYHYRQGMDRPDNDLLQM